MPKSTQILSLVPAVGWYLIRDNGDGTVVSERVVAFAAVRRYYEPRHEDESEYEDSVEPVGIGPGGDTWIPDEPDRSLDCCHESDLKESIIFHAAKVARRFAVKRGAGEPT